MAKKKTAKRAKKKSPKPETIVSAILAGHDSLKISQATAEKGFAAAAELTKKAQANKHFNYHLTAADGVPVRYFHHIGESITGIIGASQRAVMNRGVVTNHEYLVPIVDDDGQLFYLPNNKHLRELLKAACCWFQRVTITYRGKIRTNNGHHRKVYEVTPAPLGKNGVGSKGRDILAKVAGESRRKAKRRASQ